MIDKDEIGRIKEKALFDGLKDATRRRTYDVRQTAENLLDMLRSDEKYCKNKFVSEIKILRAGLDEVEQLHAEMCQHKAAPVEDK